MRLMVLCVLLGSVAFAQNRDAAREAYREGAAHYDVGDYKPALDAFKRAYLNFEDPVILFNIGQCQRNLGMKAEAMRSFRLFLNKTPNTKERPQVEKLIAELQASIDHDKAVATHPPLGTLPPTTTPAEPPHEAPPPPPPPPKTEVAPAVAVVAPAPAKKPLVKRAWFWGTVAGVAVVVGAGIALGVTLGAPSTRYPQSSLGQWQAN